LQTWVEQEFRLHTALVCGSYTETTFGKNTYDEILTNFSPKSKNRKSDKSDTPEIDLLIATDCISEGQNLQDCDYVINYDIHWNPVRVIQRFGRIDRIGSDNTQIQLVNFWVTEDLDQYINLKHRVETKMALVDLTATGQDNILSEEQLEDLIDDDLKFRTKQLKKLQEEVLDIEEIDESVSLTDFTLDDFRIDLATFLQGNKKQLQDTPQGIYAVVPASAGEYTHLVHTEAMEATEAEKKIIRPGVIFCLAQKGDTQGNKTVNPLSPYFLIYVYDDGTIRYNYTNAKTILEVFKTLCLGVEKPYHELCTLFNSETEQGTKMDQYTHLLEIAATRIVEVFGKRNIANLTTSRSAVLIPELCQIHDMRDFDLVTWLIIK
jgi:hypothetical protein